MRILTEKELGRADLTASAVTIGNFDGVHLGHQAILRTVRDHAVMHGDGGAAEPERVVMTFEPHPRVVLGRARGETHPALLTTFDQRTTLLAQEGMDTLLCIEFTLDVAGMAPEDFIEKMLMPLSPVSVIVGHDFNFGRGGAGTAALLRRYGVEHGFDVTQVPAVLRDDTPVSSSRIRALLAAGEIGPANELLTRPHTIRGPVVHGDHRGAELGYPTANVDWDDQMLPGDGVYAGTVRYDETDFGAMINIGVKPTFATKKLTLEAHLFDFDGSLYDETIDVSFVKRLRSERSFASTDALIAAIQQDERAARACLASVRG